MAVRWKRFGSVAARTRLPRSHLSSLTHPMPKFATTRKRRDLFYALDDFRGRGRGCESDARRHPDLHAYSCAGAEKATSLSRRGAPSGGSNVVHAPSGTRRVARCPQTPRGRIASDMAQESLATVGLTAAVTVAGTAIAPGVGNLVVFLTRKALDPSDQKRLEGCLVAAMDLTCLSERPPFLKRIPAAVRMRRARKQAAKDRAVLGPLFLSPTTGAAAGPTTSPPGSDTDASAPGQSGANPPEAAEPFPYLLGLAASGLTEALERTDLTTWTVHLSNRLAAHAEDCLKDQDRERAAVWATVVTGKPGASASEARALDLVAWAEAVALRFEVNLARDDSLSELVTRLDARDERVARVAMFNVAHGIRTALFIVAVALVLLLPEDIQAFEKLIGV
jgi:hypothetical protein